MLDGTPKGASGNPERYLGEPQEVLEGTPEVLEGTTGPDPWAGTGAHQPPADVRLG